MVFARTCPTAVLSKPLVDRPFVCRLLAYRNMLNRQTITAVQLTFSPVYCAGCSGNCHACSGDNTVATSTAGGVCGYAVINDNLTAIRLRT
jgi:hypothetical protein